MSPFLLYSRLQVGQTESVPTSYISHNFSQRSTVARGPNPACRPTWSTEFYWKAAVPTGLEMVCSGLQAPAAELSGCDGDQRAREAQHVTIWTLTEKVCPQLQSAFKVFRVLHRRLQLHDKIVRFLALEVLSRGASQPRILKPRHCISAEGGQMAPKKRISGPRSFQPCYCPHRYHRVLLSP